MAKLNDMENKKILLEKIDETTGEIISDDEVERGITNDLDFDLPIPWEQAEEYIYRGCSLTSGGTTILINWYELRDACRKASPGISEYEISDALTDYLGTSDWSDDQDYAWCSGCDRYIYLEDIYSQDYWWGDGDIVCGDCVREHPQEYLDWLTNNASEFNGLLEKHHLEDAGFDCIEFEYDHGYSLNENEIRKYIDEMLNRFPDAKIIIDYDRGNQIIWVKNVDLDEIEEESQDEE